MHPHKRPQPRFEEHSVHPVTATRTTMQMYSRCLWIVSVSISLLSARYLLVELNFHYPLLLFCAQLGMTTCFAAANSLLRWSRQHNNQSTVNTTPSRKRSIRGILLSSTAVCFDAFSMVGLSQAALHYYNLSTLVMLFVSCFRVA